MSFAILLMRSFESTPYTFSVPTSLGNVSIPQLGGTLTLNGRDSKIHVTDYDVGGINLIYSSADIYTHGKTGDRRVLLVYGLEGRNTRASLSIEARQADYRRGCGQNPDEGFRRGCTMASYADKDLALW